MALFDLPQKELHTYTGSGAEPFDFDALWNRTIVEARTYDRPPVVTPMESDLTTVDVYDVRFPGFGGQSIAVWLRVPRGISGPLPAVAEYVGYGGGPWVPRGVLAVGIERIRALSDGHPRTGISVVGRRHR